MKVLSSETCRIFFIVQSMTSYKFLGSKTTLQHNDFVSTNKYIIEETNSSRFRALD